MIDDVRSEQSSLYAAMVAYVVSKGWSREEEGSGWWYNANGDEETLGAAVDICLIADGIDMREEPAAPSLAAE